MKAPKRISRHARGNAAIKKARKHTPLNDKKVIREDGYPFGATQKRPVSDEEAEEMAWRPDYIGSTSDEEG
jgi:hypothetical protein